MDVRIAIVEKTPEGPEVTLLLPQASKRFIQWAAASVALVAASAVGSVMLYRSHQAEIESIAEANTKALKDSAVRYMKCADEAAKDPASPLYLYWTNPPLGNNDLPNLSRKPNEKLKNDSWAVVTYRVMSDDRGRETETQRFIATFSPNLQRHHTLAAAPEGPPKKKTTRTEPEKPAVNMDAKAVLKACLKAQPG